MSILGELKYSVTPSSGNSRCFSNKETLDTSSDILSRVLEKPCLIVEGTGVEKRRE